MTHHLHHPVVDGLAVGVAASFLLAAAAGWAVAYRIFGPRRKGLSMTDDDAAYFQAHKDDPDEWGDPEPPPMPRSESRRLDHMFSVRVGPDDAAKLRGAASAAGLSVSALMRQASLVVADKLTRPIPPHTCGVVGCDWCDPFGKSMTVAVTVQTVP